MPEASSPYENHNHQHDDDDDITHNAEVLAALIEQQHQEQQATINNNQVEDANAVNIQLSDAQLAECQFQCWFNKFKKQTIKSKVSDKE